MSAFAWANLAHTQASHLGRTWTVATLVATLALAVGGCAPVPPAPAATAAAPTATGPSNSAAAAPKLTEPTTTAVTQTKVSFVVGFLSPNTWPIYVAVEKGFFKKYGLDVEVTQMDGAPKAVAGVVGNSAEIGLAAGGTWLGPVVEGAQIKVVATLVSGSSDSLLVNPEIDSAAKLKGKRIAIGGLGDLSHLTAWLMVEKLGLDPANDVAYLVIGSDPARAAALQAGSVDAAPVNATNGTALEKEFGFRALVRGAEANISFPSSNVGVTAQTFQRSPGTVKGFLKGLMDGLDWLYTAANEQEARQILAKYFKVSPDDPSMKVAYDTTVPRKEIRLPPWIDESGFAKVQDFSARFNPKLKDVALPSLLDRSLLEAAVAERK